MGEVCISCNVSTLNDAMLSLQENMDKTPFSSFKEGVDKVGFSDSKF